MKQPTTERIKMSLLIELRALEGARVAASRDETRAYITGVMVCPHTEANAGKLYDAERDGQALLVATDGHRMVVGMGQPVGAFALEEVLPAGVTVEPHNPDTFDTVIIPPDMVKAILRVKVRKELKNMLGAEYFWLHNDAGALRAVFYDGQVVQGFKAIDAAYCDWHRVFNLTLAYRDGPAMVNGLGFNTGFLADLKTFSMCYGHEKAGSVQMFGNADDAMTPVVFEARSPWHHKGYYLLMPMRV